MNLNLQNASIPDGAGVAGARVDIVIVEGLIQNVSPHDPALKPALQTTDLGGALLLSALGEPHAHLDKVLTADLAPNLTGDLMGAIDAWNLASARGLFAFDNMVERTSRALESLLLSGVTAVRTHVNIGVEVGIEHLLAVQQAARSFASMMDIQIVALMHSPITGTDGAGNRAMLAKALEAGVDLVGGCPHLDPDPTQAVAVLFAAASEAQVGIDLHTDESLDPQAMSLLEMARYVQKTGFSQRVAASHCVSLSMQPVARQREIAREVAAAAIAVIPQPQTNLYLQGRSHPTGMPRALAPISLLREAGVLVAGGGDNVQDPFNPVGRNDPLETAALLVMAGHQSPLDAFAMVAGNVRTIMGLAPMELHVGDPADFLVIEAPSVRAAIADASHNRQVFHRGRLVASSQTTSRVFH
jgi:cytosine/creatinine deaminase